MQDYQEYLKQVTLIQQETIRRLINYDHTPPLELAEMFEGIANQYLDISEQIRDHYFVAQQATAPSSLKASHAVETAD
jgi:hypothetical protein